nr:hypothetical protein [uncultured Flavobacterium sp.]
MRFYLYILFFLMMGLSYSQTKQVIIIQHKYDFQTEPDAYNINNMFKGILLAEGFDVYFDDEELPLFVAQNRCNALNGVVLDKSNVFVTKLKFVLKDCQNKILFESAEVKSKEKNIQNGYIEALKLFSPELKKYNSTLVQKNDVVEIPSGVVSSSIAKYQFVQIANGFAIMDSSLKVVLQIYNTTNHTIFIADKFGVKGIFTKIENKGIFEYYKNDKLVVEEYLF